MRASTLSLVVSIFSLSACPTPGPQGLNNWCVNDASCLPGLTCDPGIHQFCFFGDCDNPGCLPTIGCNLTEAACCDAEHRCADLCCSEGSRCETVPINGGTLQRCSALLDAGAVGQVGGQ